MKIVIRVALTFEFLMLKSGIAQQYSIVKLLMIHKDKLCKESKRVVDMIGIISHHFDCFQAILQSKLQSRAEYKYKNRIEYKCSVKCSDDLIYLYIVFICFIFKFLFTCCKNNMQHTENTYTIYSMSQFPL